MALGLALQLVQDEQLGILACDLALSSSLTLSLDLL